MIQILSISIPLGCLAYFILFSYVVSYFQQLGYAKACYSTEKFVKSSWFGLIIYVYGQIGAGKTTCCSGLTNLLTKVKKEQAQEKIESIITKLPEIDFNLVNPIITRAFKEMHITNSDTILSYLLDVYPDIDEKCKNKFYDNFLFPVSYFSLLKDYIHAYIALLRNNYVYFTRRNFYSWNTNNWAMKYLPDMIDIKDRFTNLDYKLQHYTTIFEDEKILSGKKSTEFMSVSAADGGGDAFLRLIRQMGKGSIHYITTLQDFNRSVKQERELATGIISIEKRNELFNYSLANLFRKMIIDFLTRWKIFFDDFKQSYYDQKIKKLDKYCSYFDENEDLPEQLEKELDKYDCDVSLSSSSLRDLIKKLNRQEERRFADSFLNYESSYYTSSDDVGKRKKDCVSNYMKLSMCFPLSWCYGSIDTYSFSALDDFLSMHSYSYSDYYDPENNSIPVESQNEFINNMFKILMKNKDDINQIKQQFKEKIKQKEEENKAAYISNINKLKEKETVNNTT